MIGASARRANVDAHGVGAHPRICTFNGLARDGIEQAGCSKACAHIPGGPKCGGKAQIGVDSRVDCPLLGERQLRQTGAQAHLNSDGRGHINDHLEPHECKRVVPCIVAAMGIVNASCKRTPAMITAGGLRARVHKECRRQLGSVQPTAHPLTQGLRAAAMVTLEVPIGERNSKPGTP